MNSSSRRFGSSSTSASVAGDGSMLSAESARRSQAGLYERVLMPGPE
jgi:hypothetical protein